MTIPSSDVRYPPSQARYLVRCRKTAVTLRQTAAASATLNRVIHISLLRMQAGAQASLGHRRLKARLSTFRVPMMRRVYKLDSSAPRQFPA
jgi:hypothetical protein